MKQIERNFWLDWRRRLVHAKINHNKEMKNENDQSKTP